MRHWSFWAVLLFLAGCSDEQQTPTDPKAVGQIFAVERMDVLNDHYRQLSAPRGEVEVTESHGIVTLTMTLEGFAPNTSHAVHIHNGTCESPGTHWNQNSEDSFCGRESMGFPWLRSKAGDIGNVTVDEGGKAIFTMQTDLWTFNSGLDSDILGKVIVVHEQAEDLTSACFILTAHDHSGNPKVACGNIELLKD